jgi:hypothetical protein
LLCIFHFLLKVMETMKVISSPATKAFLYDDACPLCRGYSGAFVQHGLLQPTERLSLAQMEPHLLALYADLDRCRHEIPLLDLQGGPTLYGVEAMGHLLGRRFPWVPIMLRFRPLRAFFTWLYALISYNRRLLLPSPERETPFNPAPDFRRRYRLQLLSITIGFAALVTWAFGQNVGHYLHQPGWSGRMLLVCGSGWVVQLALAAVLLRGQLRWDYAAHLGVLMAIGTGVLLPGMLLSALTNYQFPIIPLLNVALSSGLMLWGHRLRVKRLGLSQRWTLSWLLALWTTAVGWLLLFSALVSQCYFLFLQLFKP